MRGGSVAGEAEEEEVVVVKKETKKKETGLRRWSRRLSSGFWRK